MLRRHHRFFQSLLVLRDGCLVVVAFWLAHTVRFAFPQVLPFGAVSDVGETRVVVLFFALIWPLTAWVNGLYRSRRSLSLGREVWDVVRTSLMAFMLIVTLTYFFREVRYSRGVLVLACVLAAAVVGVARGASWAMLRALRSQGINLRHVVVVGSGRLANRVIRNLETRSSLGIRVLGVMPPEAVLQQSGKLVVPPTTDQDHATLTRVDFQKLLADGRVDQVIIALSLERLPALRPLMDLLSRETVDVRLVPDVSEFATLCGSVENFSGLPIITLQASSLVGWGRVSKRVFDVMAVLVGGALAMPLLLCIALAVKVTSPGPVLYRQRRVGMDGRCFDMLKFRSMVQDAEQAGGQMAVKGDPRRTRLGAFLRETSLDELPQLWNVLRGDMSLVGPRPERPCFIESFKDEIPRYALRHKIKAGMTGWAQVNGLRGNTSMAERIELDLYYIEHWSLGLDVRILLRTFFGGFLSPHAY